MTAPAAGTVTRVAVAVGQQVDQGAALAVVEDDAAGYDSYSRDIDERNAG